MHYCGVLLSSSISAYSTYSDGTVVALEYKKKQEADGQFNRVRCLTLAEHAMSLEPRLVVRL